MVPAWLNDLAMLSLAAAFISALIILWDLRARPQAMAVMNPVWPVTALYFGPLGLWAYWRLGRAAPASHHAHHHHHHHGDDKPFWVQVFAGTTHCGAGCTLGDIVAEFLVFFSGLAIAGSVFAGQLVLDYAFAFLLGIVFQYYSIVPMRGLQPAEGIKAAVKADFWSLTAFEVGLFAWMALTRFVFFGPSLQPDSATYWFMMQIGMIIGFATAFPMNWLLIKSGVKEPCM
ncbi:DUF4396 domain-containing protein [Acidocella facilis]|uniref:DUF4396 domain-containing protein n=1 Tax=Acidocella facilis TaxID=525 RepID=UPI001F1E8A90|nr:DUF4396 domain-containing protein [Acidocella facilis]